MWISSILNSLSPSTLHARLRRRPSPGMRLAGRRLSVEPLEDRTVPSFTFTDIADTGPASPYGGLPVGQAINNLGQVAFVAVLNSSGQAIYRTEGDGQLTTIAHTDAIIKDFYLSPYMNDAGTVSFGADLWDGKQAIFTGSGGALTRIADSEQGSLFGSLPAPAPRIGSDGTVVFQALLTSGVKGFFSGNGGSITTLYVTGGDFSVFPGSPASQVHGDAMAFRATLTGGPDGVFRGNGVQTETIVTAGATYSSFLASEINDDGTVGINANLTAGGQAIVMAKDGMLTTFVDTSGPYSRFAEGKFSISNLPGAVFGADLRAGGTGIFDGPDPAVDKVLAKDDELFGSTVVSFPANFLNPRGLNNVGQILFRVNLADGRTVLVRADPPVAPTDIALSPSSVAENQPADTTVGTFSTTDPDTGDTFTYVLVGGAGDTDNTSFAISGGTLQTAASFDFETKSSYSIRVRSTDAGGLFVQKVFTISVTNVNEAPTDIALSASSVAENQPAGTTVGTFSTTDPDLGDTFTYTLASVSDNTDNASFTIDTSGNLKTAARFDFEAKSSYSIRTRSTDAGGLFVEKVFTVSIINVNEAPTITLPPTQTAAEDADLAIRGLSVGDPDGDNLTVALQVSHGKLSLGSTAGLSVVGNGSGAVTLTGSLADLNTALDSLLYRGALNYGGADTLSITASDGSLNSSDSVAITVRSAAQQAADLQAQVNALLNAGVLNKGQANSLNVKLDLQGNDGDIGKVQSFLNEVAADLNAGILTQAQASLLLTQGNLMLTSLTRR